MANTLTGLIPTIYRALNTVSRERLGFHRAVRRDTSVARAALNQTISFPIVPQGGLEVISPAATAGVTGSQTITAGTLTLNNSYEYPIIWTGEEELSLSPNGMYNPILADQFAQGFRTFTNQLDADLAALYKLASRACGATNANPFGTAGDFSDFASPLKILDDNGSPMTDLHLVLNSAAMFNIRAKQSSLFRANEAGTEDLLRRGVVGQVEGLDIHSSAGVIRHTAGGGTLYVSNVGAGLGIGATSIAIGTGSGTVLAGDVISFAGDPNKYVVKTGVAAPGTIVINAPGLRQTLANGVAMTIEAVHSCNMAFARGAIILAARPPAVPSGGDMASDRMIVVDPYSGLPFEVSTYRQYKQIRFEIGLVWGVQAINSEHITILMGLN